MRLSRLALPLVACLVAGLVAPIGTAAAAPPTASSGPIEHVLLALAPQDRPALRGLAQSSSARNAITVSRLDRALPSLRERKAVGSAAQSLGLRVVHADRMSVLVSGRASLIRALFGSARAVAPASPMQQALPNLPAAFGRNVTVAFGGDDNRPAFHHFTLTDGSADGTDFRTAYGDAGSDPRRAGAPTISEKNETIATVQLSGWHPNDLTHYRSFLASKKGGSWPTPQYRSVDDPFEPSCIARSFNDPRCPDNIPGDDIEVDLDQEAIYATAPYAHQRAYLSGNDLGGMYDSLGSIGDDASQTVSDSHLVAATISWGFCESQLAQNSSVSSIYAAFEDVISYDLATGVTLFAASGDNGNSCDDTHTGVSYPASSPQVIAVGGTQATNPSNPSTQTGWVDSFGASAGGSSAVFPRPGYQNATGAPGTMRTVPDIAALAGSPGFDLYTSSPSNAGNSPVMPVFGTSLASPVAATTYAAQVAAHNYSWGVGDILPGLYAQSAGFTDVNDNCANYPGTLQDCPGWNGADVAHAGYDEVTGLGTPVWSSLVNSTLGGDPHLTVHVHGYSKSRTLPVTVQVPEWQSYSRYRVDVDSDRVCTLVHATASKPTKVTVPSFQANGIHDLTLVAYDAATGTCHYADAVVVVDTIRPAPLATFAVTGSAKDLNARWGGTDFGGSGINKYVVNVSSSGKSVFHTTARRAGRFSFAAKRGHSYNLTVTATDRAGNVGATVAHAFDDAAFARSGKWSRANGHGFLDGRAISTAAKNASAAMRTDGTSYTLYVTTCPSCGRFSAVVGGRRKVFDTYSKTTRDRVPFVVFRDPNFNDLRRGLTFRVLGTHNGHSSGTKVVLDALTTTSA